MHLSEFSKKKLSPFTSTNKLLCNILILKCFHFIFVQFILFFRILRIFWPKKWGCPDLPDIPRNYTPAPIIPIPHPTFNERYHRRNAFFTGINMGIPWKSLYFYRSGNLGHFQAFNVFSLNVTGIWVIFKRLTGLVLIQFIIDQTSPQF